MAIEIKVTVGNAAHLHVGDEVEVRFEIFSNGQPIDPSPGFTARLQSPAQIVANTATTYVYDADDEDGEIQLDTTGVFLFTRKVMEDGLWQGACLSPGPIGAGAEPFRFRVLPNPLIVGVPDGSGDPVGVTPYTLDNVGGGAEVAKDREGITLPFRTFEGAGGIDVYEDGDTIKVDGSGLGGGGGGDGNATSIQDTPVSDTAPTLGQVLVFDGAQYVPGQLSVDDLAPAFVVTMVGAQTVEVGATVATPAFTASYAGGPATSVTLTDSAGTPSKDVTSTPTSFASDGSFQRSANNASVTFTTTAVKGANTKTSSVAITWRPPVFWGVATPSTINEAFVESLASSALASSRARTLTVNAGSGQKIYYAFPTSYGTPTFTIGGFEGGFEKVGDAISVTNSNGVTQTYDVWASTNASLGSTTVVVT